METKAAVADEAVSFGGTSKASAITELNENDVLFGRGAPHIFYIGNLRFRDLVSKRKADFMGTGRHHVKKEIADKILDTIEKGGGRFLSAIKTKREARKLGVPDGVKGWVLADKAAALRKIKQALREDDAKRRAHADDSPKEVPSRDVGESTGSLQESNSSPTSNAIDSVASSRAGISSPAERSPLSQQQELSHLQLSMAQQAKMQQYAGLLASYQQQPAFGLSSVSARSPFGMPIAPQGQGYATLGSCVNTAVGEANSSVTLAAAIERMNEARYLAAIRGMIQQQQESERAQAILSRNQLFASATAQSQSTPYAGLGLQPQASSGSTPPIHHPLNGPPSLLSPTTNAASLAFVTPTESSVSFLSHPSPPSSDLPYLEVHNSEGPRTKKLKRK